VERREVGGQGVQVAEGPGGVGASGPLGQLLEGQAAVGVVLAQRLHELLAVGVGGAQGRPPLVSWFPFHGQLLATGVCRTKATPGYRSPN
jgi:hypothetical protein